MTAAAQVRDYGAFNSRTDAAVGRINAQMEAQHRQFVLEAEAAERAHRAHVAAALKADKAKKASPWVGDPAWHAAKSKVAQLQQITAKNDAEIGALAAAGQMDSERFKQVREWQTKAQAALAKAQAEVTAAEADARLRQLKK